MQLLDEEYQKKPPKKPPLLGLAILILLDVFWMVTAILPILILAERDYMPNWFWNSLDWESMVKIGLGVVGIVIALRVISGRLTLRQAGLAHLILYGVRMGLDFI